MLFGYLNVLTPLLAFVGVPKDIANILIGLIVLFVAAKSLFDFKLSKKTTKKDKVKKGDK